MTEMYTPENKSKIIKDPKIISFWSNFIDENGITATGWDQINSLPTEDPTKLGLSPEGVTADITEDMIENILQKYLPFVIEKFGPVDARSKMQLVSIVIARVTSKRNNTMQSILDEAREAE